MATARLSEKVLSLSLSIDDFTTNFYQTVSIESDVNLFMSPFSVAAVLYMAYLGAKDNTAKQLENTLRINPIKDPVQFAFLEYLSVLEQGDQYNTLKSANRLYANEKISISEGYKNDITKYFLSAIISADFAKNIKQTQNDINEWVKTYTNGKIVDLIPDGVLTPETMLVLINAIYFKGNWAEQFPEEATTQREFYINPSKTINHDSMYISDKFYTRVDHAFKCKIIELPYQGNNFSMYILLPDDINGLPELEKKVNTHLFKEIIQRKGFRKGTVDLFMPKFRLEASLNLVDVLKKMGLLDIFDAQKSDLSGITLGGQNLFVSDVIHKAFVDVNEKGTEAAAATGLVMFGMSMEIGLEFNIDHPFMFLIADKRADMILFMGKVINPTI